MSKRIIIVGANAAGIDAAIAARKTNKEAEITLVTGERVGTYSRCGLPFVLSGLIRSFEDLIVYPSSLHRVMRFDLRLETRAVHIDTEAKTVEVETKDERREELGCIRRYSVSRSIVASSNSSFEQNLVAHM